MTKEMIPRPLPFKARLHLVHEENARLRTRIAALEAKLAERTGGVKVRELEWKTLREGESYGAVGAAITYRVAKAALSATAWSWYRLGAYQNECESFDAARAAAQADYERRILAALEPAATCKESLQVEPAAPEAQLAAFLKELSGNPGELIDRMAEAIRGDTTPDETPWSLLPEDRKAGWRGDAERALAVVKEYLTARLTASALGEQSE